MPVSSRAVRTAIGLGIAAMTLAACAVVAAPAGAASVSAITNGGVAKTAAALKKAPSGVSMPRGNPPGFTQVLRQDFTTPAALGTFGTKAPYLGWNGYNGNQDTSREYRSTGIGVWNDKDTVSVKNGLLDCKLYTNSSGTPQVCAITPTGSSGQWWKGNLNGSASAVKYGRYSVRFQVDAKAGYKIAWLLWPVSNEWNDGEVDFPEGDLNGTMTAAAHDVGDPVNEAFHDSGITMSGWHTASIEWKPGSIAYLIDGRKVYTATNTKTLKRVPTVPMRWALQAESQLASTPPNRATVAHIRIDWLTMYTYSG